MQRQPVHLPSEREMQPELLGRRRLVLDDVRREQPVRGQLPRVGMPDHVRRGRNVQRRLFWRHVPDDVRRRLDVHSELLRRKLQPDVRQRQLQVQLLHRRQLHVQRHRVQTMKKARRSLSIVLVLLLFAGAASAQNPKALAKEAYDRGTQAQERGDFKRAAEEFARADALAPSPVALQAALDAAVDADDPIVGAELLERSKRAPAKGALVTSIDAATKKLGGRAGRLQVVCPAGAKCTSTVDGAALDTSKGAWMRVGPHTLVVQVDGAPDTRTIEIRGGEELEVVAVRGAPASPAPTAVVASPTATAGPPSGSAAPKDTTSRKPLSPVVFFVTGGVAVVFAGVSTVLALSAKGKHDDFVSAGCDKANASSCGGLKDDGESVQRLANIGFAATAVAGVTTVILGAFFTDWGGAVAAGRAPAVVPVAGGAGLSYGSRF